MDLSKLSDEELQNLAGQIKQTKKPKLDLSHLSDDELSELAGENKMGTGEALFKKATQGALFGTRPVFAGVGGAIGQAGGLLAEGSLPLKDRISNLPAALKEGFVSGRQEEIADLKKASERAGLLGTAAEIGGGLLTGGVFAAPATVGKAALAGAGYGGLQAAGTAESLPEAAAMVGGGALLGGAAQGLANKLTKPALREAAEEQAFRALGPYAREARKAFPKGEINTIGREALDSGVLAGKSGFPQGVEAISEAAEAAKGKVGAEIGDLIGEASKIQALNKGFAVDRAKIIDEVAPGLLREEGVPGALAENRKINALLKEFLGDSLTLDKTQKLKESLGKSINWDRLPGADIPLKEEVARKLYTSIKNEQEKVVESLLSEVPELAARYRPAKESYRLQSKIQEIAGNRAARDTANRLVSPSDYGMGGVGGLIGTMATGNPLTGAAVGAGAGAINQILRKYGPNVAARVLDAAAKRAPQQAVNVTPAAVGLLGE
jgi:hypothetical protein